MILGKKLDAAAQMKASASAHGVRDPCMRDHSCTMCVSCMVTLLRACDAKDVACILASVFGRRSWSPILGKLVQKSQRLNALSVSQVIMIWTEALHRYLQAAGCIEELE